MRCLVNGNLRHRVCHEKKWLKDVKDALEMAVRSVHRTGKIWKCKVLVINEHMAREARFIV